MRGSTTQLVLGDATPKRGSTSRFVKGSSIPKPSNVDGKGLISLLNHPLNTLIVFAPFGIASHYLQWGKVATFWLCFFAMVPLAKILGDATEELAAGLKNDMLAGLLNATFGNAVEMVIMVQTLRAGLFDVVKATLLGSVLSNMLLVLGMSFFFGGIVSSRSSKPQASAVVLSSGSPGRFASSAGTRSSQLATLPEGELEESLDKEASGFVAEKVQHFHTMSALVSTSMLLISCLSFSLVTVFHTVTHEEEDVQYMEKTLLPVSRMCSLIVISSYGAYIIFQLGTHRLLLAEDEDEGGDGEGEEEPAISVNMSIGLLFVSTVVVAYMSEILVESLEEVTEQAHLSMHFIGIILLPIVGNACEHVSAVRFAIKDRPGLSIGIAIGSSTQIALFVVPCAVITGWILGKDMDLNFGALNTTVMTLSVVVVLSMVVDGQSNWLQGYLLMAAYAVIAVLYYHLPNVLPEVE